ncbi:MAG: non-ribosomal peptide synthetase [Burkholderiaceae bacterium]
MEQLLVELNKLGIKLQLDGEELRIFASQGVLTDELRHSLRLHKNQILDFLLSKKTMTEEAIPVIEHDLAHCHEPFPLTDLQHAYWLGRDSNLEMGSVATHLYVEFDCRDVEVARLNDALCRMIERHGMLRAVVESDGMQRILPAVPSYRILVNDCSTATPEDIDQAITGTREILSHQVLKTDQWPLFDIRATLLPDSRLRLHVSLDLLILDASSIFLFFREWRQLYAHLESQPQPLGISFRDCVLAERSMQDTTSYKRAYAYWMERIDMLPPAPALPLRSDPAARKAPRFSRREAKLDKLRWEKLKANARTQGLTPSGLLLAVYSAVLARWSTSPHFTLNVTISNRLPLHQDVNKLFGDFTSLMMHEVDYRNSQLTFVEFARCLQKQFFNDLQNRQVSGLTVLREWAKRRGIALQASMPVVFSSGLAGNSDEEVGNLEQFGQKVYSISQTSQVWLDHHVVEVNGDLIFNWDAADAVFEDGVLDAMFTAYCDAVERLADGASSLWNERDIVALPKDMQERREQANRTTQPILQRQLHGGFVAQALTNPAATAILSPDRKMTYGDLLEESVTVADWLIERGVRPGRTVAILMHKGWEQIVAVYGVLLAGGVYMPVDADLPVKRQLELLRIGEATQVLTQPGIARDVIAAAEFQILEIQPGIRSEFGAAHQRSLDTAHLDQLAYVIFTSGTTGVPKGVMIDHHGAVNTIQHINRQFHVGPLDRVLAVSSLSFDLSVYDIFGLLDAGGALVIPDYRKGHDPIHWRDLMVEHDVTLWNSAPQLMRMLMDSFYAGDKDIAPLRTVLLSGDFIPLDLPDRIRRRYVDAGVISLGGATEASIWSIYYPIKTVDPSWSSIPYGKPLPNQTIWVYDTALRPCPDHVKGHIYIGGIGLAKGYWRDVEKTATRFITHPKTGERLYDTGDIGRYAADGNVVILGRDDGQIKIRGHRVELGEIEAVLNQHADIRQSVVLPTSGQLENRQLIAYVESAGSGLSSQSVKVYLSEYLPDYMVPLHVVLLDAMPVSANGKIDYRALPAVALDAESAGRTLVHPRTEVEQAILNAWSHIIAGCEIGVTDNFFELGGDSIMATQLVRELNSSLPLFKLEMHELFENLTIESLAALYQKRAEVSDSDQQLQVEENSIDKEAMLADIRAAVDSFAELDFKHEQINSKLQGVLLSGATGWIGVQVLAELLSLTQAKVYCLVRPRGNTQSRAHLIESMRRCGIEIASSWLDRVELVSGDLAEPRLGLSPTDWHHLSESVDAIYHLGASLNVMVDYATHRSVNVGSIASVVCLAVEHHLKPIFFSSPMAVCRRHTEDGMKVLHEERPNADPDGLPTGYAQSKWAAEQILLAAAERGLPVKIYRTSHALPSYRNGLTKQNDTYVTALHAACAAGVVPNWTDSALHGVPVDLLARLMVENSLVADQYQGIIHIENRTPFNFNSLAKALLEERLNGDGNAVCVAFDEWKALCLEAATRLPDESASLAKFLFMNRPTGSAVEHIFGAHPLDTSYFDSCGKTSALTNLTPVAYWRMVRRNAGW